MKSVSVAGVSEKFQKKARKLNYKAAGKHWYFLPSIGVIQKNFNVFLT